MFIRCPLNHGAHRLQKESELEGITAVRTLGDLATPSETSVSIITNPKVRTLSLIWLPSPSSPPSAHCLIRFLQVTLGLLEQAKALSVPALWLQPGAEDEAVISYIKDNSLSDKVIYGGPCILVEGDNVIKSLL